MRLTLLPLDDRPVSRSLPAEIAAIAGVDVEVPGPGLRPHLRATPPVGALSAWYADARARTDASVVSLDALGFGSLLASRDGQETVPEVLAAWAPVSVPGPPVHAAIVVPRTPDSADAMEEPAYWDPHGPALHRLSADLGSGDRDLWAARDALAPEVPDDVARDWVGRRLRQHTLALAALDLFRRGALASLVVGIDDAAQGSLSARAQRDLTRWLAILGAGPAALVHPGADETGAVLVARAVLAAAGGPAPTVAVDCAVDGALDRVAPYETGPVAITVARQLRAAGARVVPDPAGADCVLVVHPPAAGPGTDWALAPGNGAGDGTAEATARTVARHLRHGRRVAVADVAHPNGADPALVEALAAAGAWPELVGYAGWNTAGNTLGTVAAQVVAVVTALRTGGYRQAAHRRALARRVVEDFGWMSRVRAQVRAELGSDPLRHDVVHLDSARRADYEARLSTVLAAVPGFGDLQVEPGSLRLPWDRTFEVDLAIGSAPGTSGASAAPGGSAEAGAAAASAAPAGSPAPGATPAQGAA